MAVLTTGAVKKEYVAWLKQRFANRVFPYEEKPYVAT